MKKKTKSILFWCSITLSAMSLFYFMASSMNYPVFYLLGLAGLFASFVFDEV